jgi:hypothetical protein
VGNTVLNQRRSPSSAPEKTLRGEKSMAVKSKNIRMPGKYCFAECVFIRIPSSLYGHFQIDPARSFQIYDRSMILMRGSYSVI